MNFFPCLFLYLSLYVLYVCVKSSEDYFMLSLMYDYRVAQKKTMQEILKKHVKFDVPKQEFKDEQKNNKRKRGSV